MFRTYILIAIVLALPFVAEGEDSPRWAGGGLVYGIPNGLSVNHDFMWVTSEPDTESSQVWEYKGYLLVLEAGLNGGMAGVGYGYKAETTMGNYGIFGTLSYLRTWQETETLDANTDLIGVELKRTGMMMQFKIGYFLSLDGKDGTISLAVGAGL